MGNVSEMTYFVSIKCDVKPQLSQSISCVGVCQMPDYPDKAHPPLGICVMILVILNVSYLLLLLLLYWISRCPIGLSRFPMWRGVVQVPHSYGHCPDFLWGGAFPDSSLEGALSTWPDPRLKWHFRE